MPPKLKLPKVTASTEDKDKTPRMDLPWHKTATVKLPSVAKQTSPLYEETTKQKTFKNLKAFTQKSKKEKTEAVKKVKDKYVNERLIWGRQIAKDITHQIDAQNITEDIIRDVVQEQQEKLIKDILHQIKKK